MIAPPDTLPPDFLAGPNGLLARPAADFATLPLRPDAGTTHRIELALTQAARKADILTAFARAFDMPRWFGHNWDALYDCLTDLEWLPEGQFVVLLSGSAAREKDRITLLRLLEDACDAWQDAGTAFHVFIDPQLLAAPTAA